MRRIGVILAILALIVSAPADAVCVKAEALLNAGLLEEARTEFSGIELNDGGALPDCVPATLERLREGLIDRYLAQAQIFESRGDIDAAAEAINNALAIDPWVPRVRLAYNDLQWRTAPADNTVARARELVEFGRFDEARDLLIGALNADSADAVVHIPSDLQFLSGGDIEWWRPVRRWLSAWLVPALEIVAAVIVAFVFGRLTFRIIRRRPELRIEEFSNGAFQEEHFGPYFSNNVLNGFERLKVGAKANRVQLVSGPIEPVEVPSEVSAVIPETPVGWLSPLAWAKAIPALIGWLFPRRVIALQGELHTLGNRGVGVTVRLLDDGRFVRGYAFWDKDFDYEGEPCDGDNEEKLYRLADYVSVWLLFEVLARYGIRANLLGTSTWRSYALFRAGLHAETDERNIAATRLYQRALSRDPDLRGARVNLGRILIADDPAAAIRQFRQVQTEATGTDAYKDPTFYSAVYYLAATLAKIGDIDGATKEAEAVVTLISETRQKIHDGKRGYNVPKLVNHLDYIQPAARSMYGALLVKSVPADKTDDASIEQAKKGQQMIKDETWLASNSALHQFNLTCAYTILAKRENDKSNTDNELVEAHLKTALLHLERSFQLQQAAVGEAIENDFLTFLRAEKSADFDALVAGYSTGVSEPEEEPLLLAEYELIDESTAQKFADRGWQTEDDLLKKTLDTQARRDLADDLTVPVQVVTQWAHAMDMSRLVGVGAEQVNLLLEAKVTSISELAQSAAQDLTDTLGYHANLTGADAPTKEDVSGWIDDARHNTKPKVT